MNRILAFPFLCVLCLACPLSAQAQVQVQENVQGLHDRYRAINRSAMGVLGAWSAGNLIYSGLAIGHHRGEERHFHTMNLGWASVNGLIAGLGWFQASRLPLKADHPAAVIKRQSDIQQVLALNTGLDLAYMAGGWWMWERGRRDSGNAAHLRGFGKSLILQGGFLFAFDLSLWLVHRRSSARFLQGIRVSPDGQGLGMRIPLSKPR